MTNQRCKIVAIEHLSLDGVYQAPARADEDTRNDFKHGGWSMAGDDPKMREVIGEYMADGWSILTGRTTYEDLYEGWVVRQPSSDMTKALTNVQKFVISNSPNYTLPWENSVLLKGNVNEAIAKLKAEHDKPLLIFGSGILVRSLMLQDLVDEFLLITHPLILGEGFRFFDSDNTLTKLKLVNNVTTATGVILSSYKIA